MNPYPKSATVAEAAVLAVDSAEEFSGLVVDAVGLAAKNAVSSAVEAESAAVYRTIDPIEVKYINSKFL